jgi:hypothetical protein
VSALALNDVTQRTYFGLQQNLDGATRSLRDGLRDAGFAERRFRKSQIDVAARLCSKVFGVDYAAKKAAEAALVPEKNQLSA